MLLDFQGKAQGLMGNWDIQDKLLDTWDKPLSALDKLQDQ